MALKRGLMQMWELAKANIGEKLDRRIDNLAVLNLNSLPVMEYPYQLCTLNEV